MPTILTVLVVVVVAVAFGAAGFYAGMTYRKRTAEAKLGSAEEEAKRIVNDAIKSAEQKRKETIVEAKDEAFRLKSEADKEIKDRRAEISRQERRMDQKEEALDKRTAAMERKEEDLKKRSALADARLDELEQLKLRQVEKLETIAAMTQEDARAVLLKQIDDELTHEKAMRIAAYQANMKDECDNLAREIIGQAIARCAADATSEATVSVVPLPSDEMKGRIIGREGRNIRALETATGCDLIIDDTPEAITRGSFDQSRRAIARMAMERLIADGDSGKGSVVLGITREDVRDIMNIRLHLEGLASYYAAKNITSEGLEDLRHIIELQSFYTEKKDPAHVKEMDDQFHMEICRQSGRHVLADTLIPLHKRIQKYRRTSIENPKRSAEIAVEHRKIYEAIAAHDAEAAAKLTEEHLQHAMASIMSEEEMK